MDTRIPIVVTSTAVLSLAFAGTMLAAQQGPDRFAELVAMDAQSAPVRWAANSLADPAVEIVRETLTEHEGIFQAGTAATWVPSERLVIPLLWDLTANHRPDTDQWRLAATVHGGGHPFLRIWDVHAAPAGAPETISSTSVLRIHLDDRDAPSFDDAAYAMGLSSPCIIEHTDHHWLIASAEWNGEEALATNRIVVLAELGASLGDEELPHGRQIASGVDPRIVESDDGFLLAVRQPQAAIEGWGDAAVHFYRSSDGGTWTEDAGLSSGVVSRRAYAVALHGTTTWLATWAEGGTLAVFHCGDAGEGWIPDEDLTGAAVRGRDLSDGIWLLPDATEGATRPRVAFVNASGALEVR